MKSQLINLLKSKYLNFKDNITTKKEKLKHKKEEELMQIEMLDKNIDHISNSENKDKSHFDVFSSFIFWFMWALVVYLSYLFYQSLDLLYLVLTAYIISIAMETIIEMFQNKIKSRWLSIFLSYIILFWFLISWFILIVPFILSQFADILKLVITEINNFQVVLQKPEWLNNLIVNTNWIPTYIKNVVINSLKDTQFMEALQNTLRDNITQIVKYWSSYVDNLWSLVLSIVKWFFSGIFNIILVFVMSFFFSLEKDWVIKFLSVFSTNKKYFSVKMIKLYKKLWFRLKWQLLMSVFIWCTVWIVLLTLSWVTPIDLPSKFTLALIAWITEFVPILWPILGAIPAVLIAITTYWFTWFVIVWVAYYIIQWFENNVLIPIIMNKALWLSPLVIFIAMLIWWSVLGFTWIVLSVPIAVIVTLVFEDFVWKNE